MSKAEWLRKWLRGLYPASSTSQDEDLGMGEQVLALVQKEGEKMKPTDMRCEAKVLDEDGNESRCNGTKSFEEESDTWLRWCEDHAQQENTARAEGGPRVERVETVETDSEE